MENSEELRDRFKRDRKVIFAAWVIFVCLWLFERELIQSSIFALPSLIFIVFSAPAQLFYEKMTLKKSKKDK